MMLAPPALPRRAFLATASASALARSARADAPAAYPASRALAADYIGSGRIAGAVFAIGGPNGDPTSFAQRTYRLNGQGPSVGLDTLFRLYSMSKPVTGMAAMLLVEDGRLSLDQPLYDIFPAFRHMQVAIDPTTSLAARPATRPILIRHLLTHTSGLSYSIGTHGLLPQLYARHGIVTGQVSVEDEKTMHRPPTLQALANEVATLPLLFEPGTQWSYSIGLDMIGAVIEQITGQALDRFLRTRIFQPLGMDSTGFQVPADQLGRLVPNYVTWPHGTNMIDAPPDSIYARRPALFYGGAGLVSSARDYARFTRMLLNEGHIGPVRIMQTNTARLGMSNLMAPGVLTPQGWGFGAGGRVVLKDEPGGFSKGAFGWDGAFDTVAWVDRSKEFYAVFMTQIPIGTYRLDQKVVAAIYADRAKAGH